MSRTSITLPETLRAQLEREARKLNLSVSHFIKTALAKYLKQKKASYKQDSFFSSKILIRDKGPTDTSLKHDQYLYDDNKIHGS